MSYYPNQQQGYPPYQGHSPAPTQGYGQPPNQQQNWNQAPPMQNQQYQQQGYPQQGYPNQPPPNQYGAPPNQYGAPPNQYQQQGWNNQPPPNQYGQQQQPYGAPPNQYPQQQGWNNQPPPNQYPQQGYPPGPPPQGQPPYGAPPNQFGGPPPNQYGAPQQPGYGAPPQQFGPPADPSPGYGSGQYGENPPKFPGEAPHPIFHADVSMDIEGLHKAMKGFGTNEKELIRILSRLDPLQANKVRIGYQQRLMKDLVRDLEKETSGYFENGLVAIARGPLIGDCYALHESMKGLGTKESVLNDVLMARSNADMYAIKNEYQKLFHRSLESDLRGDLSAATEQMFVMIVNGHRNEESTPIIPQQIDQDVTEIQRAIGNMVSKDAVHTCQILTSKSNGQLRAISAAYQQKFHKSLDSMISSKFTGHMKDALLLLIARANNHALSDAIQLEDSMAGMGTKDVLLVQRVVRAHWNRGHMQQVKTEYQNKYRKDLIRRIEGETRGDYEKLMVACCQ